MSLPELTTNLNHVRNLADKPALSADELKSVFDLAGNEIKEYINSQLLGAIETAINNSIVAVQNVLTSTSITDALSAKQGKVLKDYIDTVKSNSIEKTILVTESNTNLDDYIEEGTYYFSENRTPTNIPIGVNGWLQVMKGHNTNVIKQIWYRHGTINTNDFDTYVRTKSGNNNWGNWTKIATQKEVDSLNLTINGKSPTNHASSTTTFGIGTPNNYGHVKTINDLNEETYEHGKALSARQGKIIKDLIDGKAPTSHSSENTTFGIGTPNKYGHVKIVNSLTETEYEEGKALAARQGKIIKDLIDGKASISHASANTTYGVGTASNYGHCKVIDNLTTSSASNGQALNAHQGYVLQQNINAKAPTSHASSATTYGVGTASNYGHCKVINNLTTSSASDGNALNAYQGKVLKDLIDGKQKVISKGTNTPTGGSNGDIYIQYFT